MSIRLPAYDELTQDEQRVVYNLPLTRNYLVKGAPGTGKSIIALYRAARLEKTNEKASIKFLVFNKTLRKYLEEAVTQLELNNSSVDNWQRWFNRAFIPWYNKHFAANLNIKDTFDNKDPGWSEICDNVEHLPAAQRPEQWDHLILDEAQDLPSGLIRLLSLLAKNATVFADTHQRIIEGAEASVIEDIMYYFSIEGGVYYLTRNFRNTEQIADVAQTFYVGQQGDQPAPTCHTGPKPRLTRSPNVAATADYVANLAENSPGSNIGLILPPDKRLQNYYAAIASKVKRTSVQLYQTRHDDEFDFDRPGIKIMSFNVMKGLEFDTVVVPELGHYEDCERSSNILYVASTRAERDLVYVYSDEDSDSFAIEKLQAANAADHSMDEDDLSK